MVEKCGKVWRNEDNNNENIKEKGGRRNMNLEPSVKRPNEQNTRHRFIITFSFLLNVLVRGKTVEKSCEHMTDNKQITNIHLPLPSPPLHTFTKHSRQFPSVSSNFQLSVGETFLIKNWNCFPDKVTNRRDIEDETLLEIVGNRWKT